jgi:hypothetical protein
MLSVVAFVGGACAAEEEVRQTQTTKLPPSIEPIDRSNEGVKAFADLAVFYENNQKTPPYKDALARLNAPGASGDSAARYVLALCKQSLADQTNGRGHWQATPFWGQGPRSSALEFRKTLTTDFCRSASGDRALDIALWLVKNDESPAVPKETLAVFERGTGAHCADVYRQLLQLPYSLAELTPAIIDQVGARQMNQLRPEIQSLEKHYRKSVRQAARKAAQELGLQPATGFVPETAYTPWLEQQLQDINKMVYGPIPPGSQFSCVVLQTDQKLVCWVLKNDDDAVEVLDTFGRRAKYLKHPSASSASAMKMGVATSVTPYDLKQAATDLIAVRGQLDDAQKSAPLKAMQLRGAAQAKLSPRGDLTAQFEDMSISVPEALVATWCYSRGDKATAAQLLFPCIDGMADDRQLATAVRNTLGTQYYHEMLDDFSLSRDYPGALAFAANLLKPQFGGAFFQEQVRELSSQLKARSSDFNSFSLPQPSQWQFMKMKMSIKDQIDFLAPRLRLLNCQQYSQPGGIDFEDPQYKEALQSSKSPAVEVLGWHWQPAGNGTEVINPYVELSSIMENHDNIPLLLPYLKDKNYVLAVGFWRDFHPARSLTRVNDLVARIINHSAQGTLVDPSQLDSESPAEQDSYLKGVLQWCKAHQKQSKQDLSLETLRTTKDRNEFRKVILDLLKDRDTRVLEVFDAKYKQFDPFIISDIAPVMFSIDSPETKAYARKWLARPIPKEPDQQMYTRDFVKWQDDHDRCDGEMELRTCSAILLLKGDSKDQDLAINALGNLFDTMKLNLLPGSRRLLIEELHSLLKVNRKDANDLACRLGVFLYSTGSLEKLQAMSLASDREQDQGDIEAFIRIAFFGNLVAVTLWLGALPMIFLKKRRVAAKLIAASACFFALAFVSPSFVTWAADTIHLPGLPEQWLIRIFSVLLTVLFSAAIFLPAVVARRRQRSNRRLILMLNMLLVLGAIAGWIATGEVPLSWNIILALALVAWNTLLVMSCLDDKQKTADS